MTTGPTIPTTSGLRVVDESEWDAHIAGLGASDAYSCAAYHRASALLEPEGTRPVLLAFNDGAGEVALPLLLRPLPDGNGWDATSAYGYGGPVGRGAPDLAAFGAALDRWATEYGVVSTFLRLNPLLGNGRLVPPTAQLIDVGYTVGWDLSPGRNLRRSMQTARREAVGRAERAGVSVTVTARPSGLEDFREVYEESLRRLEAEDRYYPPESYWQALLTQDQLLVPVLVEGRVEGRLVYGLLCLLSDRWLHSHFVGGNQEARALNASAACYFAAAQWGQAHGLDCFHLGGGLGGNTTSSLYEYKQRFDPSSPPHLFQVAKLVHDRKRYRQLADTDETDGFFPPWRRPR